MCKFKYQKEEIYYDEIIENLRYILKDILNATEQVMDKISHEEFNNMRAVGRRILLEHYMRHEYIQINEEI